MQLGVLRLQRARVGLLRSNSEVDPDDRHRAGIASGQPSRERAGPPLHNANPGRDSAMLLQAIAAQIADGTSNTIMYGIIAILIGL